MLRIKNRKEQLMKRFRCFSIEIAIFWTIILIYTLISKHYVSIIIYICHRLLQAYRRNI